jgi:hypothetical protein
LGRSRRRKREPLELSPLLAELAAADDPPTELEPYLGRLVDAGAVELYVARQTESGVHFAVSTAEQARAGACLLVACSKRVIASGVVDWQAPSRTPAGDALERLVDQLHGYDRIARFRFAATDMEIAAQAASGLIEAEEGRGSARAYRRVIETGMVVTYARPFLASNEAGLGERWWPKDEAERAVHDELIDLRGEYHAHATHAPERRLEVMPGFYESGRPLLAESWIELPEAKLRLLEEMAKRQAERFKAEADRLDLDLFGPRDPSGEMLGDTAE